MELSFIYHSCQHLRALFTQVLRGNQMSQLLIMYYYFVYYFDIESGLRYLESFLKPKTSAAPLS